MEIKSIITKSVFLFMFSLSLMAQAPTVEWMTKIGHHGENEYGIAAYSIPGIVNPTTGGTASYVAGGSADWEGSRDILLVMFNAEGDSIWSNTIGTQNSTEYANAFHILPDGRYIFAGAFDTDLDPGGGIDMDADALIMITAENGDHIYSGHFGVDTINEQALDVTANLDSGYTFAGVVSYPNDGTDMQVYRLSHLGAPVCSYIHEESDGQIPYSIAALYDGGFVVVGDDKDHGTTRWRGQFYKALPCGAPEFMFSYPSDGYIKFRDVKQLADSGIVFTGLITHDVINTTPDLYIRKLDKNLNEVWTKIIGDVDKVETGNCVEETDDGGLIVGGTHTATAHSTTNFWAVRLDKDGEILWEKSVGTTSDDYLNSISVTDDGGFILCGNMREEGSYKFDMLVVKLGQDPVSVNLTDDIFPTQNTLLNNYPNPFNPSTTINYALSENIHVSLKIYDMLGREIRTLVDQNESVGYKSINWNGRSNSGTRVSSGLYIYRIIAGEFIQSRRMLLLK